MKYQEFLWLQSPSQCQWDNFVIRSYSKEKLLAGLHPSIQTDKHLNCCVVFCSFILKYYTRHVV